MARKKMYEIEVQNTWYDNIGEKKKKKTFAPLNNAQML